MPNTENARRSAGADLTARRRVRRYENHPIFGVRDARTLGTVLGGEASGNTIIVPGPGHSRRDRSLSIRLDPAAPDGFLVHSFAGDDPVACRDYVRAALGLPSFDRAHQTRAVPARAPSGNDVGDRARAALALWRQAGPVTGTLAERYLRSRGLTEIDSEALPDVRFHGGLHFDGRTVAGMVALMRDVRTNKPCGVHRTFLDSQGCKLGRKMLGRAKGACVKLSENDAVTTGLGIAEGIETALSVMQAGWTPVWACLSAGTIAAFPVLPGVECLTVFSDHDPSGMGERVAQKACARWLAADREAVGISPDVMGDWNDLEGVAA